jgi:pimeloyl-ACP methyl ester carboxylesterase
MTKFLIRDVSLNVKIFGSGYPLVIMHGGPGGDLYTMMSLKPLKDQFTLIFYDHRCNGRSTGADVKTMTWENLTADADALREKLGFNKWAVLGHSFGGNVALEYALRYPKNLSHLILVNSGADYRWVRENAPDLLAQRGFSKDKVDLARRFLNGHNVSIHDEIRNRLFTISQPKTNPSYDHDGLVIEVTTSRHDLWRDTTSQGLDIDG